MEALDPFDLQLRTRLVFGNDSVDRIGELAIEYGAGRVLVVTDPGLVASGHVARVVDCLRRASLGVAVYDAVRENPTTADVDACVAAAREAQVEFLIGLGGGSSMDTAKGCNFVFSNGGRMEDYWGVGKAKRPMLPLIAIPTTAGTGSETQSFALISREDNHQKMACGDPKACARVAILDPTLTLSQPRAVAACTALDTLAHAVETAVTRKRTAASQLFSRRAFQLAHAALPQVLAQPDDLAARGDMLLAAAFAGVAIENSMLGAAHSLANPLTAHHGMVHGQAVGLMLPHVVRYNGADPASAAEYHDLARLAGLCTQATPDAEAVELLSRELSHLLELAGEARSLGECGVTDSMIDGLAAEAASQWTAQFNPREVTAPILAGLYREVQVVAAG